MPIFILFKTPNPLKPLFILLFTLLAVASFSQDKITIPLLPGEKVWSGIIKDGEKMPYSTGYSYNLFANNRENQLQPLLLGNKGLWVWSEEPYAFEIQGDQIFITQTKGEIKYGHEGSSMADARKYVSAHFFPASGKMPDELLFAQPQYNTWIELTYHQNQADVLKYAQGIIDNGFPPGVIMIDDTWQEDYGVWRFHPGRFPDAKAMVRQLHQLGFKVMVWICPFVSADQAMTIQLLMKNKALLMQQRPDKPGYENATDPAIIKWWNGYSASLDFTSAAGVNWFNGELDRIVKDYDIDGFKFDAGDMNLYPANALSMQPASPNRLCELYAQFGLRFPLNEYRACWKMAGQPLAQRLHDKNHSWEELQLLIPQMITEGLAGYTFSCPDMVGGGNWVSFLDPKTFNQDLVVRSAQIHALMPMMQFSVAPWRILDSVHLAAVKQAVVIRKKFSPLILELARKSAKTGDPIVSSLEYHFPNQGFEHIKNEFILGDSLLVAPVDGQLNSREVVLPKGKWVGDDGKMYVGGKSYRVDVPLGRMPYFLLAR